MSTNESVASEAQQAAPDPRYPIGPYRKLETVTVEDREYAMEGLALLPEQLRNAVEGLSEEQLDTPLRQDAWTVRQLVHHITDSHMHASARVRFALTESGSPIRAYDERAWAALYDARVAPVEWSLELMEALHARWVMLLQHLTETQWACGFLHPEHGLVTVEDAVQQYAWHARHHTAQITRLRMARGW